MKIIKSRLMHPLLIYSFALLLTACNVAKENVNPSFSTDAYEDTPSSDSSDVDIGSSDDVDIPAAEEQIPDNTGGNTDPGTTETVQVHNSGLGSWVPVPLRTAETKAAGRAGGEMGQMGYTLTISAQDPMRMAMGIDTAGIYVSEDGGYNWAIRKEGIKSYGVQSVAFDITNSEVMWAAGSRFSLVTSSATADGIYRSDDLGRTWTQLRSAVFLRGRAQNQYFAFDPTGATSQGSQVIYAVTHDVGLLRTTNGGGDWTDVSPSGALSGAIYNAIIRHPVSGDLWLAADEGLWFSSNDALTWTEITRPATGPVSGIAVHPADPLKAYIALGASGVWVTVDGGENWRELANGLPSLTWARLAISPVNPDIIYVDADKAGGDFPYFSNDAGASWQRPVQREEGFFGVGHYFSEGLVSHPTDALTAFSLYPLRKTIDGGKTWSIVGNGVSGARRGEAGQSAIAFRPDDPKKMMFFHTDWGSSLTEDSGDTWTYVPAPSQAGNTETQPGGAYDPRPSSKRVVSAVGGWYDQSLAISQDDGATWTVLAGTVDDYKYFAWHPQSQDVIYAGTTTAGLRSDDAGDTWNPISRPIRAMYPGNGDIIYALNSVSSWQFEVMRSNNRGDTWSRVGSVLSGAVRDIAVDPQNPDRLYVVGDDAIWVYDGTNWSKRNETNGLESDFFGRMLWTRIAVDPRHPNIVYAGQKPWEGHGRGIFRSIDYGQNWENINWNMPVDLNIWSISVSPHDSTVWLATDYGNWRMTPGE